MNGLQEAFEGIRQALDSARVRYAIGGSWASTTFGEPRQTNGIDIIAASTGRSLGVFLDALGPADYYVDLETCTTRSGYPGHSR